MHRAGRRLEVSGKGLEYLDRSCQTLRVQDPEVLINGLGRALQASSDLLDGGAHQPRVEIEQMHDELIGGLGIDAVCSKDFCGKVLDVAGDDHVGARADGRGKHVSIVRVRELPRFCNVLVPMHEAVEHVCIHLPACLPQLLQRDAASLMNGVIHSARIRSVHRARNVSVMDN